MNEALARILVVDDEWITRLEVSEMLAELGYQVAGRAESGQQGVEMVRNLNPDLVLMDIVMPGGMNGIEAARQIRAESNTPVIFISGYADPQYIQNAKEVEPLGYVMKPFDKYEVLASVEIALYKNRIEDALRRSEERYRSFVEGTDDLITQVTEDGVFTFVNQASEVTLGLESKRLLGMSALDSYVLSLRVRLSECLSC